MSSYFVTRHPGAIHWAKKNLSNKDLVFVTHLDTSIIEEGDEVIGSLPIHLAAEVCSKGAHFYALVLTMPPELRGKELTDEDMDKLSCSISPFFVKAL